jgi:Tol biopolymer transport system component
VAYEAWEYEMNVWRVDLPASGPLAGSAFAAATDEWSFEPRLSPDGTRLAFVSTRSGSYEVWVAKADGEGLVRLTSFGGPYVGQPRWSPDGTRLAFVGRPAGHAQVFVVDATGGAPTAVTRGSHDALAPSWSHDGNSIYFTSRASGSWQVHARGLDGTGERQVTRDGGYAAIESADGRWLYFSRIDRPGLWRRPPGGGGAEESVTAELRPEHWACWGLTGSGAYWLVPSAGDSLEVRLLRPGASGPETIARLAELAWPGLELSGDGRTLFYSRVGRHASNLVLMALERGPRPR